MNNSILFLGDSITDCGRSSEGSLGSGYVSMISGMLPEKYHILNRGYDGLTVSGVLKQWRTFAHISSSGASSRTSAAPIKDALSISQKPAPPPFVVSVLVGINDAGIVMNTGFSEEQALVYFERDFLSLVSEIKACGCRIIVIEPFVFPRPAEYIHWEPCVHHISQIVRRIAAENDAHLIVPMDHFRIAANRSSLSWGFVTTDGIHLTTEGHMILAGLWRDAYFSMLN